MQGHIEGGVGDEFDQTPGFQVIFDEGFRIHAPGEAVQAGVDEGVGGGHAVRGEVDFLVHFAGGPRHLQAVFVGKDQAGGYGEGSEGVAAAHAFWLLVVQKV